MIADIILVSVGVIGLLIASIFDLKTREVPDWLSFCLIAAGLGVRVIYSLQTEIWQYALYGLAGAIIFFLFGSLMYYAKQWGGGDVKLLAALGALFATAPFFVEESEFPFLLILLINILLSGAVYGLCWSFFLAIRHRKKFWKEFQKLMQKHKAVRYIVWAVALTAIFVYLNVDYYPSKAIIILCGIIGIIYAYLFPLIQSVENVCMYKWLSPFKLTEGDWIAKEVVSKGKVICGPKDLGMEKDQIRKLIRLKIKKVLVKEGIPFVPSFLIGALVSLIFGSLLI